jgi:putative flavoprotein involved in K+ transport
LNETVDTVIVGGGQAGLAVSYYLTQQGRPHVVLEQAAQAGAAWRNQRWDSFTFVTPNWMTQLPGAVYAGPDPDGFLARPEIVAYFEHYVARYALPVRYETQVTAVGPADRGYRVQTRQGGYHANHVVMATVSFQQPRLPPAGAGLPPGLRQLHSGEYRNPQALPPGAVLIVGSGQSGCQIAEELYRSGRKVYLSIGRVGRLPRRYRGQDITRWLQLIGFFDRTVDQLPSPQAKFAGNPQLSGAGGGRTLNLHRFVRDGVTLLGRLREVQGSRIQLAPDVSDNLAQVDKFERDVLKRVDDYIEKAALAAPADSVPQLRDGYTATVLTELDLKAAGITSVIWATGYRFDYSLVKLPIFDADGYPAQRRGVTAYPGLYFVGLSWLSKFTSATLLGVGEDAAYGAAAIAAQSPAGQGA